MYRLDPRGRKCFPFLEQGVSAVIERMITWIAEGLRKVEDKDDVSVSCGLKVKHRPSCHHANHHPNVT
jgi:hypothetical protein